MESVVLCEVAFSIHVDEPMEGGGKYINAMTPDSSPPAPSRNCRSLTLFPLSASEKEGRKEGDLRDEFVRASCHATITFTARSF